MTNPEHKNNTEQYQANQLLNWVALFIRGAISLETFFEGLALAENDPQWNEQSKPKMRENNR